MAGTVAMKLADMYGPRVRTINQHLMRSLDVVGDPRLKAAMAHYPAAGGKRLRPLLATVVCEAFGGTWETALTFGIALELVHNFTLVHDDVMDEDDTRRGIRTVHAEYGTSEAILAGDVLFARAFEVLGETAVSPAQAVKLTRVLGRTVRLLGEGQQMDLAFETAEKITPEDYMNMIERKTSVLYSAAAQGGVIVAGGTAAQEEALFDYGRLLGLGFQIWDDVLDLRSDQETLGKPVLNDIRKGKKTLIVVKALENLRGPEKEAFLGTLGNKKATVDELRAARDQLEEVGAVEYAVKVAKDLVAEAKGKLVVVRESPEKQALTALADYAVSRKS